MLFCMVLVAKSGGLFPTRQPDERHHSMGPARMADQPTVQLLPTPDADVADDTVLPFQTVSSSMIGRVVRLGPAIDEILGHHNYPDAVSEVLGQALALTALLGTALKFDGKLTLQTQTDGPLRFLVVNFETPGKLRAYANYDADAIAALMADGNGSAVDYGALMGSGHLAMTIDAGADMDRHQGIVALDGDGLTGAAMTYFRQSEQLPTFLRLSVARHFVADVAAAADTDGAVDANRGWHWRAGGLLLQHLASEGGHAPRDVQSERDEQALPGDADDDWTRVRLLAGTVEDHELLDPLLAPERLLFRLFHEEGVRVSQAQPIDVYCQCSRDRVAVFLKSFGLEELSDMRDARGDLVVTCEFCATDYRFTDADIAE